jgi:hypothetical protein
MKTSTKIDGYSVEFEKYEEDGETRTQCFVMQILQVLWAKHLREQGIPTNGALFR